MALLDAALAFALTLAALATVVTIVMEIVLRFLGSKAFGQVQFVLKLFDYMSEVMNVPTLVQENDRWQWVKSILENPFAWIKMRESKSRWSFLGPQAGAVYTDISLEHFLRRVLSDSDTRDALMAYKGNLTKAVSELSAKYDEYVSAIGVKLKDRAKLWSLVVGICVALVMNVDGVRLFQDYVKNPEITAKVIRELEKANEAGSEKLADKKQPTEQPKQGGEPNNSSAATPADLDKKMRWLEKLSLPIGTEYFPYCTADADGKRTRIDPLCAKHGAPENFCDIAKLVFGEVDGLAWLFKVIVTGLLIGLGAPFWYDVARRLGEVRTAFRGRGTAEQRHRGADPKKEPEDREKLIERIVRETS